MPEGKWLFERFAYSFERVLKDARGRMGDVPCCNMVLVKDCARDKVWRNSLYESYKKNRCVRTTRFNSAYFRHTYDVVLPDLQTRLGYSFVEIESAEADDVVALIHREVRNRCPDTCIGVLTNDNDYVQLVDDRTTVFNVHGLCLHERVKMEPHVYVNVKILLGDRSDNIAPVTRRLGAQRAEQLARDADALQELLDANDDIRKRYELNKILIDLRCIPKDIQERFNHKFTKVLLAGAA